MAAIFGVLLLVAAAVARVPMEVGSDVTVQDLTAFDYHNKIGIKRAQAIEAVETDIINDPSRIVGGSPANLGQFPYQAGLVITLNSGATSVCGGVLVTNNRVLTAAHCWFDGSNQARQFTVVLGSMLLFFGGSRFITSDVELHAEWDPSIISNDIAMINIDYVTYSSAIRNIALPVDFSSETFAGYPAVASGFGRTSDTTGISTSQFLSYVWLEVITNAVCRQTFGSIIQTSTLCVSGARGQSTCGGDSGGPLAYEAGGERVLIGLTSFGAAVGCQRNLPAAFVRVTSFLSWIQERL